MKPLKVLGKIFLIGCFWSLFFVEGIRVILLINWHFDIFWPPHWTYLWELWHGGWVISHAKEWAFVLILLATIPMWLTGWIFLSAIHWKYWFNLLIVEQFRRVKSYINDLNAPMRNDLAMRKVVKKKSYKEIRPNAHAIPASSDPFENHPVATAIRTSHDHSAAPASTSSAFQTPDSQNNTQSSNINLQEEKKPFVHSVFDFDDGEEDDFDLDFDSAVRSIQKVQPQNAAKQSVFDIQEEQNPDNQSDYYSAREKKKQLYEADFEEDDNDDYAPLKRPQYESAQRNRSSDKKENRRDRDYDRNARKQNRGENQRIEKAEFNSDHRSDQHQTRSENSNPIIDTLRQKGYAIISGQTIKNTYIDYIAVSNNIIALCLVDKEVGDWLADEERFNDEEPLWFSESNHRVSPVKMVDNARNALAQKLHDCNITFDLRAFVVVQNGNIINAEDMFEIWRGLDVDVTRINRGSPRELPLFSKSLEEVDEKIDSLRFESLKKLIRSIG